MDYRKSQIYSHILVNHGQILNLAIFDEAVSWYAPTLATPTMHESSRSSGDLESEQVRPMAIMGEDPTTLTRRK